MVKKFRITKDEVKSRSGYVLLGVFAGLFIEPMQTWLDSLGIPRWVVGFAGVIAVFYYFDF